MKFSRSAVAVLVLAALSSQQAFATNGMLMEGYGPIATGMGGASMAYDNGNAGMANNPATLGMMQDGSRLDVALGGLHPNVVSKMTGMPDANSGGNAYYMPAAGWVTKKDGLAYGVGLFAQGGMGTEYTATDWVSAGAGPSRSEVGVGNVIVPLAYDVSNELTVAASMQLVWAGMDLQMAMSGAQMGGLAAGGNLTATGGPLVAGLPTFMGGAGNAAYFNFTDGSAFTGKANSTGWAGKLGMTYMVNNQFTVGATYHSKTSLGDMAADGAQVSMIDTAGAIGPAGTTYTLNGKVTVVDFQFPEVYGIGMAYQATNELMVVADYKRIGWASVMKNFHMTFSSTDMGGIDMDMKMPQNWTDQDVVQLGFAYKMRPDLTVRAGANISSNPVPDNTVNPLFPAIIKNHYTLGGGYDFDSVSSVNGSLTYVPKVSVNSPSGYSIDHSQMNWQVMYSRKM